MVILITTDIEHHFPAFNAHNIETSNRPMQVVKIKEEGFKLLYVFELIRNASQNMFCYEHSLECIVYIRNYEEQSVFINLTLKALLRFNSKR